MAGNARDLLRDFELMAMAFPVLAAAGAVLLVGGIVAFAQTGNIGLVHSALTLLAGAGLFGAVAPAKSTLRRPALVGGIVASTAGVALGAYLLAFRAGCSGLDPNVA